MSQSATASNATRSSTILVVAAGSMGDVRPYALLAQALQNAGYSVIFLTNSGYETLAKQLGLLDMRPFWLSLAAFKQVQMRANNESQGVFNSDYWQDWFASYPAIYQACADAEIVIARNPMLLDFSALFKIPFILASNVPPPNIPSTLLPRIESYTPLGPLKWAARLPASRAWLRQGIYRLSHLLAKVMAPWQLRAELKNLPELYKVHQHHQQALAMVASPQQQRRIKQTDHAVLTHWLGLSPHLLPELVTASHFELTGMWRTDAVEDYRPSAALSDFLAAGPAPVYFGFGSNPCTPKGRDFSELSLQIAIAIQQTGCRAILQRGWGNLQWPAEFAANEKVHVIDDVPHEYLFPRMALIVHHGGAGTSLQAACQGVPSVVLPFVQDQFFWAWRLYTLGLATSPIKPDKLKAERLVALLKQGLNDPDLHKNAKAMGQKLQREQGLQQTLASLKRHCRTLKL